MKIVIDTNLWISFLIGKKLSGLKNLLSNPNFTIYVCTELIEEIKKAISKPKIQKYLSTDDEKDLLELIDVFCIHIIVDKKATSPVRDAKDLFLLSLAETVQANYILTGDKDLLVLQTHNQTKIISISVFISEM